MPTNWIAAYNRLFPIIDKSGEPTYLSGSSFLRMAQQVDEGIPSYNHFIQLRNQSGKSTSRKDFYWDVIHSAKIKNLSSFGLSSTRWNPTPKKT